MEIKPHGRKPYHVPAEPFREVIRKRLEKTTENEIYGAFTQVAMQIWGPDNDWDVQTCHDNLRAFMRTSSKAHTGVVMHFDNADKMLSRLGLSALWVTDPVFMELYQNVDLATLDVASPTCDKVRQEIVDTVEEIGISATAEVFNTRPGIVSYAYKKAIAA